MCSAVGQNKLVGIGAGKKYHYSLDYLPFPQNGFNNGDLFRSQSLSQNDIFCLDPIIRSVKLTVLREQNFNHKVIHLLISLSLDAWEAAIVEFED